MWAMPVETIVFFTKKIKEIIETYSLTPSQIYFLSMQKKILGRRNNNFYNITENNQNALMIQCPFKLAKSVSLTKPALKKKKV